MPIPRTFAAPLLVLTLLAAAGCASHHGPGTLYESFDSTDRYARRVEVPAERACEAARRALLSQGYVVAASAGPQQLSGRKNFQPGGGVHVELEVRVVCAPEASNAEHALVFVSALQDRYELKKSANSASVGVGALGSVSLPFSLGNDAMVRVASETVSSDRFYDRFFEVVERYLGAPTELPEG